MFKNQNTTELNMLQKLLSDLQHADVDTSWHPIEIWAESMEVHLQRYAPELLNNLEKKIKRPKYVLPICIHPDVYINRRSVDWFFDDLPAEYKHRLDEYHQNLKVKSEEIKNTNLKAKAKLEVWVQALLRQLENGLESLSELSATKTPVNVITQISTGSNNSQKGEQKHD